MHEAYEFRCASRVHGVMVRPGVMEYRCHSRYCGKRSGVVVVHWFDVDTGKLLDTKEYRDIELKREGS